MKFHSSVIFVKDIANAKDFYTRFLKFTIEHDFGKNVILTNGLTIWEIGESHIINRKLETRNSSYRFELYFETEDIDDTFEMLNKCQHPKIMVSDGLMKWSPMDKQNDAVTFIALFMINPSDNCNRK